MSEILIKKESLPARCETCHQNDEFDASTNYCQRCSGQQKVIINLAENKEENLLTLNEVRNRLSKNNSEIQNENLIIRAQAEQKEKDKHEEMLEKERQQIREWRIKNRKEYREAMDSAFVYLNSEFSPQAFMKLSFEEKLVWSHVMKDGPKDHEDGAVFGLCLFVLASILFSSMIIFDEQNLVDALFGQLILCFVTIIAIFIVPFINGQWRYFNPWRDRRVFRFYRLYKKWNRKVSGQEVSFDPSVTVIQNEYWMHNDYLDWYKYKKDENYPT